MADNLESYFKKNLSDDTPGDGDWNVPSDKVWDNVLPEIQKKRGLFIPWRYFYMAGIILLLGFISLFWFLRSPENIIDKNETKDYVQTDEAKKSSDPDENSNTTEIIIDKGPADQASEMEENVVFGENQYVDGQTTEAIPSELSLITSIDNADNVVQENENTTPIQTSIIYSEATNETETMAYPVVLNPEKDQLTSIDSKSINNISITDDLSIADREVKGMQDEQTLQSTSEEPLNNKGKFGIGVFILPTFNATTVKGDPLQGAIETSNMLMYSSNWGFEFRYFLSNKFTLVTGIGKSEIRSWSKSLIDFGYDSSTEHTMPSGEKENTSDVPMQTPFGEIDTEITYRFSGDDEIPDGEPMYSAMETHQDIRYLSIPLGVEFNIIRFSRFSWFVEGGIRYNRALKDATQFTSRILHDGNDMDVVNEEMTSHPSYTENYLNFYIGTGVNYQFSKSFQISGSARYFGNITKVNIQNNMSTYVHGFDLKIGIVYIF